MPVYQLGINGLFHDASVCLLEDGAPRMLVEEERLDRVKHSASFPERGIERCLREVGIGLGDVSDVAFSWHAAHVVASQLKVAAAHFPRTVHLLAPGASELDVRDKLGWLLAMRPRLARRFGVPRDAFRFHRVRHHVAHAYDAYASSPFEGKAAVLVLDGFGEEASTSLFVVGPRAIRRVFAVPFPHSLGVLYAAITEFLGFRSISDEYKVMGLSAYGRDRHREAFDRLLRVDADGRYRLDLSCFTFHTHGRKQLYTGRLAELLGPPRRADEPITARHEDIACSAQRAVERCGLALARTAHRLTGLADLCIVGGVGQNVCLNARIAEDGPFARVFVPPAPGDAGTAHGAIQSVRARVPGWRRVAPADARLGPAFSRAECAAALERAGLAWDDVGLAPDALVRELVAGRMVGVVHGRMEFGPRALGGRSILADPRRAAVRDRLNATIKRREGFRPFAPAVPIERAREFFCWEGESPFMSYVARVRPEQAARIPAVVHVDGTARLQTVRRESDPFFWALLNAFGEAAGVPVLLNTSFNENEPIVCSPREAIDCFLRTDLDALFLEGLLVKKPGGAAR
jgi:carbamoyltransferase